jgi:hypothetical protein
MRRCSRLSGFDVAFFFRAVLDRFDELGEEPNCTVADVQDEIFDMVKPQVGRGEGVACIEEGRCM